MVYSLVYSWMKPSPRGFLRWHCYLRMLSRVSYPQLEISNRTGKIQYKTHRKFMEVYPKAAFKNVVYIYIWLYIYNYTHIYIHMYMCVCNVHHMWYYIMIFNMQTSQVVHGQIATIVPPLWSTGAPDNIFQNVRIVGQNLLNTNVGCWLATFHFKESTAIV